MTRHPFNGGELGRDDDPGLTALANELEGLSVDEARPSPGFHDRVLAAIEAEPTRRHSWLAALFAGDGGHLLQGVALALVLATAVATALAAGGALDILRRDPGASPVVPSPSTPAATITPSPTASPSMSPSATPRPSPSASPSTRVTVAPSPSDDDDASETPRPSESDNSGPGGGDDDASETPRPSESDNSGPGGGDDG